MKSLYSEIPTLVLFSSQMFLSVSTNTIPLIWFSLNNAQFLGVLCAYELIPLKAATDEERGGGSIFLPNSLNTLFHFCGMTVLPFAPLGGHDIRMASTKGGIRYRTWGKTKTELPLAHRNVASNLQWFLNIREPRKLESSQDQ